jgi:DMSO/TMAO reductase YedYZ molybdopterin-dependent catalytic subunit
MASVLAMLAGWPSPLEPQAEFLMEWTPLPLADLVLRSLPSLARPAALLGALALTMLVCGLAGGLAGLLSNRSFSRAVGLAAGAFLLAACLAMALNPAQPGPELVLAACWPLGMVPLAGERPGTRSAGPLVSRSAVILGGAAGLLALWGLEPAILRLTPRRLFAYRPPAGLPVAGLTPLVTPVERFYCMDKVLQYPLIGPPDWRLTISGAVDRPLRLDYPALLRRGAVSRYVTMECVDNPVGGSLISNALWTGTPLARLLTEVGARADGLILHSADGDVESVSRRVAEAAGAMVAYAMNGETLPRAHGYPARLLLPGHYGFKSVKWLTGIEVMQGSAEGVWREHGWNDEALVHPTTRIDVARREGDEIIVAGVAFAGARGVRAVHVRVNGGPWHVATVGPVLSAQAWVQWAVRLRGQGRALIEARAVDRHGRVQSGTRRDAYPDGATGWASMTVS